MAPGGSNQTDSGAGPSAGQSTQSLSQWTLVEVIRTQETLQPKAAQDFCLDPGLDKPLVKGRFGGNERYLNMGL